MSVPGDLQLAVGAFCVAAAAYNYAEILAAVKNKAKTVSIR